MLKLLVTAGADVHKRKINGDARRPNGVSALELAKERDEDAVVAYLEELAAAGVTVMVPAGEGEAVTDITSTPRSPGATADARRAALEAAAHGGSARAIAQLAKMGSSDADQPDVEPPSLATTRTTAGETEAPLIELIYPDGWCGLGPRVPQLPAGAAAANDAADLDFVREVFGRVRVPPPLLSACKRAAELCEGVAAGDVAEGVAAGAAASMQALVEWVEADEAAPRPEGCAKVPPFVNLRLLALAMHGATKGRASAGKDLFVRCQEAWAGPLADGGPRLLFVPCLAALEKLTARMVALIERVRAQGSHVSSPPAASNAQCPLTARHCVHLRCGPTPTTTSRRCSWCGSAAAATTSTMASTSRAPPTSMRRMCPPSQQSRSMCPRHPPLRAYIMRTI